MLIRLVVKSCVVHETHSWLGWRFLCFFSAICTMSLYASLMSRLEEISHTKRHDRMGPRKTNRVNGPRLNSMDWIHVHGKHFFVRALIFHHQSIHATNTNNTWKSKTTQPCLVKMGFIRVNPPPSLVPRRPFPHEMRWTYYTIFSHCMV